MKKIIFVCPKCGCNEIAMQAWVTVNTLKYVGEGLDDDEYWCPRCQEHFSNPKQEEKEEEE